MSPVRVIFDTEFPCNRCLWSPTILLLTFGFSHYLSINSIWRWDQPCNTSSSDLWNIHLIQAS